jgi:hypothetical protein
MQLGQPAHELAKAEMRRLKSNAPKQKITPVKWEQLAENQTTTGVIL